MSRSNPESREKIATRYMKWSSDQCTLVYFDKSLTDASNPKGREVSVPLPFTFIVLDVLHTMTGMHKKSQSKIYSNEVKDLRKQAMNVRSFKGGEIISGLYSDIKEKAFSAGGKYASSIYVAFRPDKGNDLVIGNIMFSGGASGAWFDYCTENRDYKEVGAVTITGHAVDKSGGVTFTKPVFKKTDVTPETNAKAIALDKKLQQYLNEYLAAGSNVVSAADHEDHDPTPPEPDHGSQKGRRQAPVSPSPVVHDDLPF